MSISKGAWSLSRNETSWSTIRVRLVSSDMDVMCFSRGMMSVYRLIDFAAGAPLLCRIRPALCVWRATPKRPMSGDILVRRKSPCRLSPEVVGRWLLYYRMEGVVSWKLNRGDICKLGYVPIAVDDGRSSTEAIR